MLHHYVLLATRHIFKNKLFIFINIFGLALAIGCCIVAYYLYEFNGTFDAHHQNGHSIYRVSSFRSFQNKITKYGNAPFALGNVLKQSKGDFEKVVRYNSAEINVRIGDDVFNDVVVYTDPEFFELFSFTAEYGSLTIRDNASIVISEDLAIKYFGKTDAIGESILQLLGDGKSSLFTVTGVFKKQPNNSSFGMQAYVHYDNQKNLSSEFNENDWAARALIYVQVSDKNRVKAAESHLQQYVANNNKVREDFIIDHFALEALVGLAKDDSYSNTRGVWTNSAAHISAVVGTAAMGIFILLIACFNLTNTAIAVSSRRLKEIGMRKVMGGDRMSLILQYLSEVLVICLASFILGLFIAHYFLIPSFNALWSFWALRPQYFSKPDFLIFALLILLTTSLLAGSYPALYVSKFQPLKILKDKVKLGGSNGFTLTLLSMQLIITLIAVVCSLAFVSNARYQETLDLGFNKNEVLYTQVNSTLEYEALKSSLKQRSDVLSVAGSHHHVGSSYFRDPIKSGEKEIEVDVLDIGDDYLQTAGLTLLEGRDFVNDSKTDKLESVIVTENMAREFGWANAVGQEITWMDTVRYHVIGVVKNIVNKGMMSRIDPVMLRYKGSDDVKFCIVSASVNKIGDVKTFLEQEAKRLFPDRLTSVYYMNQLVDNSIRINNSILKMFAFLGLVAILLSATGLYTLTSLNIAKKMKEIGVRKVLGASHANITRIINKQFFILLTIASIAGGYFGASLSRILMDSIWEHFERTTLATVLISIGIIIVTSALSIVYKIYSTLRINPTTVLRNE